VLGVEMGTFRDYVRACENVQDLKKKKIKQLILFYYLKK
jgi:hypothetical protein